MSTTTAAVAVSARYGAGATTSIIPRTMLGGSRPGYERDGAISDRSDMIKLNTRTLAKTPPGPTDYGAGNNGTY